MIPISLMGHYFSMDTLLCRKEKEKKSHVDKLINGPQYIHLDIIALINLKQQRPYDVRPIHPLCSGGQLVHCQKEFPSTLMLGLIP